MSKACVICASEDIDFSAADHRDYCVWCGSLDIFDGPVRGGLWWASDSDGTDVLVHVAYSLKHDALRCRCFGWPDGHTVALNFFEKWHEPVTSRAEVIAMRRKLSVYDQGFESIRDQLKL